MKEGKRGRPSAGEALPPIGRVERHACTLDPDVPAETWSFDPADGALVQRLARLGAEGLGGFSAEWGEDEGGPFLVRRVPTRTLAALSPGERLDGPAALCIVRDLARALAVCEREGIFPGAVRPHEIALGDAGAFLLADGWVAALVGEPAPRGGGSTSLRWTPPEQAAGEAWDSRANRYVLGLVLYRLVSGTHPFAGRGLRDAMDLAAWAVPPFEDEIARSLRPGVQSLALALLDPDPAQRPRTAEAIALRCDTLLRGEERAIGRRPSSEPAPEPALPFSSRPKPAIHAPWQRRAFASLPIALGLVALGTGVGLRPTPAPPAVQARGIFGAPLGETSSRACAPCHAREVAEWQRSVMAHSIKSPLFGALESLVEEEVGRDDRCPNGAGVLRRAGPDVCRDPRTGLGVTGSGGEHWCINCHSAGDNLRSTVPAWSATSDASSRRPLADLLSPRALEGISCAVCHETVGPVHAGSAYQGNPTWTSPATGAIFTMRPEDGRGVRGIANSGYLLDPNVFLSSTLGRGGPGDPIVHRKTPPDTARYLRSSEACGACHDVRLFGTDTIGVRERGEHFKRLRNAYSEWRTWAETEKAAGRRATTCQDCHMSLYPGVCVVGAVASGASPDGCPTGFHFEARAPGERARGLVASSSSELVPIASHAFTSVDVPLANDFDERWASDRALDTNGVPVGLEARRVQLLARTFTLVLGTGARIGSRLELPVSVTNVGAGHRAPAGFSQEREIWLELVVRDARGDIVYEVGGIDRDDADLRDKVFLRTTTRGDVRDERGRPQGVFGADVVDGPDVPQWSPNPTFGGTSFRGKGLLNLQNGFLRCVRCIGIIDARGQCQPGPGQGRTRSDRFDDGDYDIDTGECRSNLDGDHAFFETYFPVGALDAERGIAKAPDAILDQRSAPPGVAIRYTYDLDVGARPGPFSVRARLRFRPFPPFLLRAFADYEAAKAAEGRRPRGPQVARAMFVRNHPIDLVAATTSVP